MAIVLASLPPACAKLFGKAPPPAEPEAPSATPLPITNGTAPPAWHPPETTPEPPSSAVPPPPNAELAKARIAADAKDFKRVKALLDKKVRGGKCSAEESQLLFMACTTLKDKACVAEVKAKHAEDLAE